MKLLDRYVEFNVLKTFVLVLSALIALFGLLEFVDQLHYVGQGRYTTLDAFGYAVLTAPSRLLSLTPVSALLGSLLAMGTMASRSELTAMRAAGVSVLRIFGWILKLGIPIMVALFLAAEFVIPQAQLLAQSERISKLSRPAALSSQNGFWARTGQSYLNVRRYGHNGIPEDIYIYTFSGKGALRRFIHADRAVIQPDSSWLLKGVLVKELDKQRIRIRHLASLDWNSFLRPEQLNLLVLPPQSMAPLDLYHYVRDLKRQHQEAKRYEQALWTEASMPLATLAMVLIALPFLFGSLRGLSTGLRVTMGAIIGIMFSLVQHIFSYLGLLLDLNPVLTALTPSLLLLLIALYRLRRARI